MPGIFISYRREDVPGHAGRLYDALSRRFGEEQVFMDLDMEPGVDFVQEINEAVGSCRLLIAVIGPRWMNIQNARGQRRLDDVTDFIRIEVEAGLKRPDVRVVPALVQGAQMPTAEELPPSLADLARRNALELSDARWDYDVGRLVSTVERVLGLGGSSSGVSERPARRDTAERASAERGGREPPEVRQEAEAAEPPPRLAPAEHEAPRTSTRRRGRRPASPSPSSGRAHDRGPQTRRSWLRTPMPVAILALLIIAAGAAAVISSTQDEEQGPSSSRPKSPSGTRAAQNLLAAVPSTIRRRCGREITDKCCEPSDDPWMVTYDGADEQIKCTWRGVVANDLVYGRWSTPDDAERAMPDLKESNSEDCDSPTANDVRRYYRSRGVAKCQKIPGNRDLRGVVIWWNPKESPVIGRFQAGPDDNQQTALVEWKKVVPAE